MAKAQAKAAETEVVGLDIDDEGGVIVDLSGVDTDGDFPLMPRGKYNCMVDSVEYKLSNANDNPMWAMRLSVQEGEFAKRVLFTNVVFTENSLFRVKQTLEALGVSHLLKSKFDASSDEVIDELVGLECTVVLDHRMWEGKKRENVKKLEPLAVASGDEAFA